MPEVVPVTSVASETIAFPNRIPQVQRSVAPGPAQDGESPFALMLDASAPPPADPAPRQADEVKPTEKAAAAASEPRSAATPDAPEKKPGDAPAPADSKADADDNAPKDAPAEGETPVVAGDALPEVPEFDEAAGENVDAATADTVAVPVPAEATQPQPAASANAAIAAPIAATPDAAAPAQPEGEANPELAVKPVAAAAPAIEPAEVPAEAPVANAPELPASKTNGTDAPDIKAKIELKAAELPADTTEPAADTTVQPAAPQNAKGEQVHPQVQHEDARLEQAENKPQHDAKPSAEPAQNKPAVTPHLTALETDTGNTPLPATPQPVTADVASLTAGNQRATTLMAQSAVPVSGIAVEIATQARAGNNRFEIRLDPPELGRIDVRLDVDQDGNVKSRLVIERADTYDLLRRDSSTLERALQQAGLKTSDNGLEFTLRDQGNAQRDAREQNQHNAERGIIPDANILPAEAASGYGRMLGLGGGVDIRI